jgi:hypothetical protein
MKPSFLTIKIRAGVANIMNSFARLVITNAISYLNL